MVLKCKTVSKVARTLKVTDKAKDMEIEDPQAVTRKTMKRPAAAEKVVEESESEAEECNVKASKMMKKPAAVASKEEDEVEESEEDEEESEEADEDVAMQMVPVEFENKEPSEKEVLGERTKELKSMAASDLKELLLSNGLETGTKDLMIKALLKHEAKARAVAQEQKAKIRAVVVKKKQELEDLSIPELGKLCNDSGLKGLKSKPERVQRLLVLWQENDGVDQALAKIAQDERKTELCALDNTRLQKLCNKLGVDPFVKEVMVERISKRETMKGCYARPAIKQQDEAPKEDQKVDMIDALLANEAQRKKEKALQEKQEEAVAQKRKELKSLSVDELKKKLVKKGLEATGKRDDMIEALFIAGVQEDLATARKTELQSKSAQELKDLLLLNGLETGGKDAMIKTLLAHEAKCREELKAFEAKVGEVAAQKQAEFDTKSNAFLKELCAEKGLPVGGDKDDKIERLIEEEKKDREFDKVVSTNNRNKRKGELMAMDKQKVVQLCETLELDPFVKDIMVWRIMSQESEGGPAIAAIDAEQPAKKKARR